MRLKTYLQLIALVLAIQAIIPTIVLSAPEQATAKNQTAEIKNKNREPESSKYPGYTIDGFATASQLAAQRSHTPAGEDERNFAVFTGIVVILIIGFVSQIIFKSD